MPIAVDRPDLELRGHEWNPGGERPVLLIHGHLEFARAWTPLADELARAGLRVIAPDLRGHGDSDWQPARTSYQFWDFVSDIVEVVRVAKVRSLMLAGHSLGGLVAAGYAAAFPKTVECVALLESIVPQPDPGFDAAAAFVEHLRRIRIVDRRGSELYPDEEALASAIRRSDPLSTDDAVRLIIDCGARRVDGGIALKYDPQLSILSPLLVAGERSPFATGPIQTLAATGGAPAHARRTTIPGAAHALLRHRPEAVVAALVPFFAGA